VTVNIVGDIIFVTKHDFFQLENQKQR